MIAKGHIECSTFQSTDYLDLKHPMDSILPCSIARLNDFFGLPNTLHRVVLRTGCSERPAASQRRGSREPLHIYHLFGKKSTAAKLRYFSRLRMSRNLIRFHIHLKVSNNSSEPIKLHYFLSVSYRVLLLACQSFSKPWFSVVSKIPYGFSRDTTYEQDTYFGSSFLY